MPNAILDSLASRVHPSRWGIGIASLYLRQLEKAHQAGVLDVAPQDWDGLVKDADAKLVHCSPEQIVLTASGEGEEFVAVRNDEPGGDRYELVPVVKRATTQPAPEGALLTFEAVISSRRKDRDGDVLEASGAEVDPNAPLLWQHFPPSPIGKLLGLTGQNRQRVKGRFAIADVALGHDAVVLVEFGALRISHGFDPLDFEPLDPKSESDSGWHVTKYEIMEISLVSVPSNVDSVITAFSRGKLHHPAVKAWAGGLHDDRPSQFRGFTLSQDLAAPDAEIQWLATEAYEKGKAPQLELKFSGSPRNPFGTHSSYKFKGGAAGYKKSWRLHFSQVNGGALTPAASGPIRGTVRRVAMIAAGMKPPCAVTPTEDIGARTGGKSPLAGSYPEMPGDYGLSQWKKPETDADREGMKLSYSDLNTIKQAAVAEIKRRIADREDAEGRGVSRDEAAFLAVDTDDWLALCRSAAARFGFTWEETAELTVFQARALARADGEKSGRSLSKRNEDRIRNARDDVADIADMEDAPRPARALAREAVADLNAVLESAGSGEEDERSVTLPGVMAFAASRPLDELKDLHAVLVARMKQAEQSRLRRFFNSVFL